jgi:hypothetical protein
MKLLALDLYPRDSNPDLDVFTGLMGFITSGIKAARYFRISRLGAWLPDRYEALKAHLYIWYLEKTIY